MIPLVDVARQNRSLSEQLEGATSRVVRSGSYILGPEVERFEYELASYLGVEHAIGVTSGSAALWCALRALGVGGGDEVICPAFSFFATAEAVALTGATPVFADIEPDSFQLDVNSARELVSDKTRAILPVHVFGYCADMRAILSLARDCGLFVVEDAAQALGAGVDAGKAGTLGDIGCYSFFPSKPLGALGDAGAIVTRRRDLAERCRALRVHGAYEKHRYRELGGNHRLSPLQAAALLVKLPHLSAFSEKREAVTEAYNRAFLDLPLGLPRRKAGERPAFALYTLRVQPDLRAALRQHLHECGVASAVYYDTPLSKQAALVGHSRSGSLPNTRRACTEVLSLPLFPELTEKEVATVISAVKSFFFELEAA